MQMTLKEAKGNFFDRKAIVDAVGKANARVAMKQGGLVKTIMKRSMRRKKGPAPAGQPPHAHEGQLRDLTFFAFDPSTQTTVVGPIKLDAGNAAEIQDKGGMVPVVGIYSRSGKFIPAYALSAAGRRGAMAKAKFVKVMREVQPRPFSVPALQSAKSKLAEQWQETVRK